MCQEGRREGVSLDSGTWGRRELYFGPVDGFELELSTEFGLVFWIGDDPLEGGILCFPRVLLKNRSVFTLKVSRRVQSDRNWGQYLDLSPLLDPRLILSTSPPDTPYSLSVLRVKVLFPLPLSLLWGYRLTSPGLWRNTRSDVDVVRRTGTRCSISET